MEPSHAEIRQSVGGRGGRRTDRKSRGDGRSDGEHGNYVSRSDPHSYLPADDESRTILGLPSADAMGRTAYLWRRRDLLRFRRRVPQRRERCVIPVFTACHRCSKIVATQRTLTDPALGEYSVQYDPANMVDWGGLRVPETFTACFEHERLRVRIEVVIEDGRPECVAISRLYHDAPPLRSERRFPLRAMVNAAVRGAAFEIVQVPIERVRSLQEDARLVLHRNSRLVPDRHGNVRLYAPAFYDGDESGAERPEAPTPRRPRSDDDWRRVAELYRRAVAGGSPPSQAIAAEFGVAAATARKWVQSARERGFLRPALGRRAGETGPARPTTV